MEEKLPIIQENGKPALRMWLDGAEVTVKFSDDESKIDVKKGILRLIMQSYEDRAFRSRREGESA